MGKIKAYLKVFGYEKAEVLAHLSQLNIDTVEYEVDEAFLDVRILLFCNNCDDIDFFQSINKIKTFYAERLYAEEDRSLAACLIARLKAEGKRMGAAESVTGGLISSKIVSVPEAGDVFYEGAVTYDIAAKVKRLHVASSMIEQYGVVSEEVCRAMVFGMISNKSIDYAVSTTGYAGRDLPDEKKGTVYIGYSARDLKIEVEKFEFEGSRNEIREKAANTALFGLLRMI